MTTTIRNPAIPNGSTVLVTGVNGLIGSHVADQFLQSGFRVRGTVRDVEKNSWIREHFSEAYGGDRFALVEVRDIAAEGAFDSAVKGVSAVVHVASNVTFDPDPTKVIPGAVDGALNALKAANGEGSVKRYVLTSSSFAASMPKPNTRATVTKDTWNEESIRIAESDPPYTPERAGHNYAASKALAEREVWRFFHEDRTKRPDLVVNTVLPSANFGKSISVANQEHPADCPNPAALEYFIDVQDDARLHVAAAIHPGVIGERIFAWAEPYNYDTLLAILRRQNPERQFIPDFQSGWDQSIVEPRDRAEGLLRDFGRQGFTSLEGSVRMNSEGL